MLFAFWILCGLITIVFVLFSFWIDPEAKPDHQPLNEISNADILVLLGMSFAALIFGPLALLIATCLLCSCVLNYLKNDDNFKQWLKKKPFLQ